ncbi:sulfultransferase [Corynebacterium ulcerans]|uniref:sulfurtransferase n=1 Tax=Corynebacterium ulcerans TaxID=65058 RepID=UPI0006BB5B69|nr:sulfurtransferase [Corynebacterium ulcerans]KPH74360.1 sulfultransferase [Corynebacterium ulcerans]OIS05629.1 sulfultransferase [Corynebacterium ulcerans]
MGITISVEELAQRINTGSNNIILASLWSPHEGGGYAHFNSEHISTARYCDTAFALASAPSSKLGRNPLPTKDTLARWFIRWGLTDDRQVVVYDAYRGLFAARAWWVLKWAGVPDVVILDGGQKAWEAAGYETLGGPGNPRTYSTIEPELGSMPTATIEDVKNHTGILLDAREANRFAGRKERLDLKAGHIPGAVNVPSRDLLTQEGLFKTPEEIRAAFAAVGITSADDVIAYSGSGNHSAQAIIAMNIAGLGTPRHYVGGWSQWAADPKNPVEHGDAR